MTDQPQHMQALGVANRHRFARAKLKRQVKAGQVAVADLLDPAVGLLPDYEAMPIAELVRAQRHWGETRTRRLLARLAIGEKRPIGGLTSRERRALVDALNGVEVANRRWIAA